MMRPGFLEYLRCPGCGSALALDRSAAGTSDALNCQGCLRRVPVIDGIPRFVDVPEDETARRTQESFGYEWTHFNDWRQSGEQNFNDYFEGADLAALSGSTVLDAGCGMGRHARQMARHAQRVIALDFSRAIDQASRNASELGNVDCVQADLLAPPFGDDTFDYVYSLGVLHHIDDTEKAIAGLIRKVRPGGRLRIYLYWRRHGWQGRLLSVVTALRQVTTRLPFFALRIFCLLLSVALFLGVVLPYRLLSALGVTRQEHWPLFIYTKYPFQVLYNDQFDRFSAPIEKRYDPDEVRAILERRGLTDVTVRPCFGWVAEGVKP